MPSVCCLANCPHYKSHNVDETLRHSLPGSLCGTLNSRRQGHFRLHPQTGCDITHLSDLPDTGYSPDFFPAGKLPDRGKSEFLPPFGGADSFVFIHYSTFIIPAAELHDSNTPA